MSSQIWFSDYVYVHVEFKVKNKATVVYSRPYRNDAQAERESGAKFDAKTRRKSTKLVRSEEWGYKKDHERWATMSTLA